MLVGWIGLAHKTSRWGRSGFEDLDALVKAGEPAIIVLWHQRVMMAHYVFGPEHRGHLHAHIRLAGNAVKRFGLGTIQMYSHKRHVAPTREVLRRMRDGVSVGTAADGPRGPARIASIVPLAWARASRKRVFAVSYSARKVHKLKTGDKMWFPAL